MSQKYERFAMSVTIKREDLEWLNGGNVTEMVETYNENE